MQLPERLKLLDGLVLVRAIVPACVFILSGQAPALAEYPSTVLLRHVINTASYGDLRDIGFVEREFSVQFPVASDQWAKKLSEYEDGPQADSFTTQSKSSAFSSLEFSYGISNFYGEDRGSKGRYPYLIYFGIGGISRIRCLTLDQIESVFSTRKLFILYNTPMSTYQWQGKTYFLANYQMPPIERGSYTIGIYFSFLIPEQKCIETIWFNQNVQ